MTYVLIAGRILPPISVIKRPFLPYEILLASRSVINHRQGRLPHLCLRSITSIFVNMATPIVAVPPVEPDTDLCSVETSSIDSPLDTAAVGSAEMEDAVFTFDETCIIFDWDDTILPSSWLAQNGLRLDSPDALPADAIAQLHVLEDAVMLLLERALSCGVVIIITNAETGWVEMSCKRFIPRVLPFLHRVKVLSARSTFEMLYPDSPAHWKIQAFHQEITGVFACQSVEGRRNIMSFGDSIHERAAIHKVTAGMGPLTKTKSIKFVERPTVEQLKRQLDLVTSCFVDIWRHQQHLDLMLTIQLLYS